MGPTTGKLNFAEAERVDFALQLPLITATGWLKLAVELDDPTHTKEQKKRDAERDQFLQRAGWQIRRFHVERRAAWPVGLQALKDAMEKALPAAAREAARQL